MTKETLRHLFDDSVRHTGWQLAVRRAIVALIAISGLMSFVETFGDFAMRWQRVLFAADCIIIAVFSIEVALRIWVGGRRYVFSFYGLVDIVSTYPFYLALIFPIPYSALRILRVLRLMRVFRYMRIAWEVTTRHPHRLEMLWKMATILHRHFDPGRPMPEQSQFKTKAIGYKY